MAKSTDVLTPNQIAEALLATVNGNNCIAWIGSGLSRPIFDDWVRAVSRLCDACGVPSLGSSVAKPDADQLMDKAEECKRADGSTYAATLARIYGMPGVLTRRAYPILMKAPFKAYVTTNLDPLLSEAASVEGFGSVYRYPTLRPPEIERCNKPIFYMHGHASPEGTPSGDSLVFCRSEFEQAYGEAGVVRNFVVNLLMNYPIVFIGCNISEPEIHQQFLRVHQMLSQMETAGAPPPPPRFILAETIISATTGKRDDGAEDVQIQRFQELGMSVLRYDPVEHKEQWEVEEALRRLCALTPRVTAGGPGEVAPR
jgi:hypothetical protein